MKTGDLHHLATYGWTPFQPLQHQAHQLQRAHHEQEVSLGPQHGVPADLPWLKMCTPPGKVALPRTPAPYVSPMAGGVLMLDVNAGVGAVAGAPPAEPDAAARAPAEPTAVAAAPLEPGAAAVTPVLVNGLAAITDRVEQPKPPGKGPNMADVATRIREKMIADKLAAKDRRDALKRKEEKEAAALKKKEEQEAGALAMEVATATAQKTVAVTGKAKAAPKKLVKVVAAKAAPKAAAKAAAKAVAKAVPKSGSCPKRLACLPWTGLSPCAVLQGLHRLPRRGQPPMASEALYRFSTNYQKKLQDGSEASVGRACEDPSQIESVNSCRRGGGALSRG